MCVTCSHLFWVTDNMQPHAAGVVAENGVLPPSGLVQSPLSYGVLTLAEGEVPLLLCQLSGREVK